MTPSTSSAEIRGQLNKRPEADDFTFRAPRWSDLTACPLCARTHNDPWTYRCDLCGDEGRVFSANLLGASL